MGWLACHPDSLTEHEQPQLKALLARCPELQGASDHIKLSATMLTKLTGHDHLAQAALAGQEFTPEPVIVTGDTTFGGGGSAASP